MGQVFRPLRSFVRRKLDPKKYNAPERNPKKVHPLHKKFPFSTQKLRTSPPLIPGYSLRGRETDKHMKHMEVQAESLKSEWSQRSWVVYKESDDS